MHRMTVFPALALATLLLGGCAAISSTTNTAARALQGVTQSTAATSDASTRSAKSDEYADARRFAGSQIDQIRREAANGGGEHLQALAALMHERNPAAFGRWMQTHYQPLFTDLDQPQMLVARIAARRG